MTETPIESIDRSSRIACSHAIKLHYGHRAKLGEVYEDKNGSLWGDVIVDGKIEDRVYMGSVAGANR